MRARVVADVPLEEMVDVRVGSMTWKPLLAGVEGDPGNFELRLLNYGGDYETPRHRHNHEQVRWVFSGQLALAKGKYVNAGEICYWSEGTYYGGASPCETQVLDLQFGSVDGPTVTIHQMHQAREELAKAGSFHDGVYTYTDSDGRQKNKDSFEASWECLYGRPIAYPSPPRYREPIVINPAAFATRRLDTNIRVKPLGVFGEGLTTLNLFNAEPGAELTFGRPLQPVLLFLKAGAASAEGETYPEFTAFHLQPNESVVFTVVEPIELLEIALPELTQVDDSTTRKVATSRKSVRGMALSS